LQADELAKIRQDFNTALATDKANHIAKLQAEKDAWAANIAKLLAVLDDEDQPDAV
jgi:hypothetical protein